MFSEHVFKYLIDFIRVVHVHRSMYCECNEKDWSACGHVLLKMTLALCKVLRPTRHKIDNFGDAIHSQSLIGYTVVLKKPNQNIKIMQYKILR